jgi:two-component system cell cycle sensor histidine kinase/response regulator CckA
MSTPPITHPLHGLHATPAAERLILLSRAVEQSPVSIIITDADGSIAYVNPRFTEVTGFTAAEVIGRTPRVLKSGEQDDTFYGELWRTITAGREWRGEFRNRRKDGTTIIETALISPVVDDGGRVTHFVAIKEDVTAQRALEDQLRQAQRLEAVGQLAGGVAHDFNNMLTVIQGFCSLIEPVLADSPARRHLVEVQLAAERSATLTRQLLAFSAKQVLRPECVELNALVCGVAVMLRRIVGEGIELKLDLGDQPLHVLADPGQLEQAIVNLCVNARDAIAQHGTITIRTSADGAKVTLAVEDTGSGIPADVLPHIFEPFFTTKQVGRGTGLGLATVHGIVRQSGGEIEVRTAAGQGTCFTITLPATTPAPAEQSRRRVTPRPHGTETVLVVEDEPAVRALVCGLLRMHGYDVLEAEDGAAAIRLATAERRHIHLLLTDVVMPNLGGHEAAVSIQAARPRTRVLFMSGYTDDAVLRHGVSKKERAFLQKPFTPDSLLQKVREVLDEPALEAASA